MIVPSLTKHATPSRPSCDVWSNPPGKKSDITGYDWCSTEEQCWNLLERTAQHYLCSFGFDRNGCVQICHLDSLGANISTPSGFIKPGWKIRTLNGGFNRKIIDRWSIFQHAMFDDTGGSALWKIKVPTENHQRISQ